MERKTIFKMDRYDEKLGCYLVYELFAGKLPVYLYKCYLKGDTAVLYPFKSLVKGEKARDKQTMSVFSIVRGGA